MEQRIRRRQEQRDDLADAPAGFHAAPAEQPAGPGEHAPAVAHTDFSLESIQLAGDQAPLMVQRQEDASEGGDGAARQTPTYSHEEQRLGDVRADIADLLGAEPFAQFVADFEQALGGASALADAQALVSSAGGQLWALATARAQGRPAQPDDRPLYWARLQATSLLRNWAGATLTDAQRDALIAGFERASRGMDDIQFDAAAPAKVLVSGFDPFGLDRNPRNSNPSGAMALAFDGQAIGGAEIESVVFPVRFADFDAGLVESVFRPHIGSVDMIVTISQGGDAFEAELYTGRRRSSNAPDNMGMSRLGTPIGELDTAAPPNVPAGLEQGSELQQSYIPFDGADQHGTITVGGVALLVDGASAEIIPPGESGARRPDAGQLAQALSTVGGDDDTTIRAARGSGGGYLSNEISYRVNYLFPDSANIPIWHLHTPALRDESGEDDSDARRADLVGQARAILEQAVASLPARPRPAGAGRPPR